MIWASSGISAIAFLISSRASGKPLVAIRERVAEGVVGVGAVRAQLDQLAQALLHDRIDLVDPLGCHRVVVEQVRVFGSCATTLSRQVERFLVALGLAQDACASAEISAKRSRWLRGVVSWIRFEAPSSRRRAPSAAPLGGPALM